MTTTTTFTRADVAAQGAFNKNKLLVIYKGQVYDVAEFADDHPGGRALLAEWAGRDISAILHDPVSHAHTDAALDVLAECQVGVLADKDNDDTGSNASTSPTADKQRHGGRRASPDLSDSAIDVASNTAASSIAPSPVPTSAAQSLRASPAPLPASNDNEKSSAAIMQRGEVAYTPDISDTRLLADKDPAFLDLTRPLFLQVWRARGLSKKRYMQQVHIPRHTRGSAPIFGGILEPLTKTPWWVVPTVWIPFVAYLFVESMTTGKLSLSSAAAFFAAGIVVWTILEYTIHRFLFHADGVLPDHPYALALHFLIHGVHHFLPMDRMRLVLPPALFIILATPIISPILASLPYGTGRALVAGAVFGYIAYDCTHYYLHHGRVATQHLRDMKTYHLEHHYREANLGFGITSKVWDKVFSTELISVSGAAKKAQ